MKDFQRSPDSTESSGSAGTGAAKRGARKSAAKTDSTKESVAEQWLHEFSRLCKVDLRASEHGKRLAKQFGGFVKSKSPLALVWIGLHWVAAVVCLVLITSGRWDLLRAVFGTGATVAVALDVVSVTVTAPGAGPTAMAAVAGDSLFVKNSPGENSTRMVAMWTKAQAAGFTQLTTPSMHDVTRGFRYTNVANQPGNMVPRGVFQILQPQDLMSIQQGGSAVAGDVELAHVMLLYDNLPGIDAQFIDSSALLARGQELLTLNQTTTATVASTYSGGVLANAAPFLLKANTLYAILGAKLGATCGALTIMGPDSGNLRLAIPGLTSPDVETVNWFVQLSEWLGLPLIPVINSANAGNITIQNVQDENLTAVPFSLVLVELSPA